LKNKYIDLIEQTFDFPQKEFKVEDNELLFNDIPLMDIIKQYDTPLKITYLPKISENIQRVKKWFRTAFAKVDYDGEYFYSYCTKSSHFSFVLEEVLKNDTHIECSSAFDIPIVQKLFENKKITKETFITCNGFKMDEYTENISILINKGFKNTIPILDNKEELEYYKNTVKGKFKIGIRIATEEEPKFSFYTSRLGIRYDDIIDFYKENIKKDKKIELKMLHFFINTGIRDNSYYWNELTKGILLYTKLKKICPSLEYLNLGGGFQIKSRLDFDYDYRYMVDEIVSQIKKICNENNVKEPNIFTEFGSFTVGESGALLLSVKKQKRQNDRELWNMVDTSFMTTLPDLFLINQKFITLPINNWDHEYERVNLGGYSCDSADYVNETEFNAVYLPKINGETQYIGIFHTGSYQDSISGTGGIKHCLIPSPKHILIDKAEDGEFITKIFSKEQSYQSMMKILGY